MEIGKLRPSELLLHTEGLTISQKYLSFASFTLNHGCFIFQFARFLLWLCQSSKQWTCMNNSLWVEICKMRYLKFWFDPTCYKLEVITPFLHNKKETERTKNQQLLLDQRTGAHRVKWSPEAEETDNQRQIITAYCEKQLSIRSPKLKPVSVETYYTVIDKLLEA